MKPTTLKNIFGAPPVSVAARVWYLITQQLAWLWRPGRVGRGGCAAALVIAGVFLVAGCNGPDEDPPPPRIAIIDISASTDDALSYYFDRFGKDTRKFAQQFIQQEGTLGVILIAGDPLAHSQIETFTFSTEYTGDRGLAELNSQAAAVTETVQESVDDSTVPRDRTALLRAFKLADREAGRTGGPLEIFVYSDGVENSEDLSMPGNELDEATIDSTLDQLEPDDGDGLLPENLSGVPISWVLPGFDPDPVDNDLKVDPLKVERFWRAWAERAGANLTYGG